MEVREGERSRMRRGARRKKIDAREVIGEKKSIEGLLSWLYTVPKFEGVREAVLGRFGWGGI